MKKGFFEGRFLINIVGSIMRQESLYPVHKTLNWERLYHLSDYHRITNIIYLGTMGEAAQMPRFWRDKFRERYHEALHYNDVYEKSENEILNLFQLRQVPTIVIESSAVRKLYKIAETAANSPLRMYLDRQAYMIGKGYLIDIGYETDRFYKGFGEHLVNKKTGFQVELYYRLPFQSKTYDKFMKKIMDHAVPDSRMDNIRTLTLESNFVFRMAEDVYLYATDSLRLRDILDSFMFYKKFKDDMDMDLIEMRLEAMNIDEIAESLIHIGTMWFGKRGDDKANYATEDLSVYDNIEVRILSNGTVGQDTMNQVLNLRDEIVKAREKEEKHEYNLDGWNAIKAMFSAQARHERKEKQKDLSMRILTEGDVTYRVNRKHEVQIISPYFSLRVPEVWLGHSMITCAPNHEDMRFPSRGQMAVNPDNYTLAFYFSGPDTGKRIPLLTIDLYSDIDNEQIRRSFRDELMFYMGSIEHDDGENYYVSHVIARYEEDNYDGWEKAAFYEMVDDLDYVLDSIEAVNDKKSQNRNSFQPYSGWHWGDLPEETFGEEEDEY